MTQTSRKTYTSEFKLEAVRLARAPGHTIRGVARELGISENVMHKWLKAFDTVGPRPFPGHGVQALTAEQHEIARLKREVETLRQEREILKAAAVFFAKESR